MSNTRLSWPVTGTVVKRHYNLKISTEETEADYNWVNFGMNKEEVKTLELSRVRFIQGIEKKWVELLANVGTIQTSNLFRHDVAFTAYEFESGKLVRVSEFVAGTVNLYSGPLKFITEVLKKLHIQGWPKFIPDGNSGNQYLAEPYSWSYNGLKITFTRNKVYHLKGEPVECTAIVFEKAQ